MCRTLRTSPAFLLLLAGCTASTTARVWGEVSYDGSKVAVGNIEFLPIEETRGPNIGGVIQDGTYDIPAERGSLVDGVYRVEIRAYRETANGKLANPDSKATPERESIFPPEYNTRSTLRVRISPKASKNRFDFNASKERRP